MVDISRSIGSVSQGGSIAGVGQSTTRDTRSARSVAGLSGISGASPNGPRGRRMLSPDTPVESLDRSAPRGTYLDILV